MVEGDVDDFKRNIPKNMTIKNYVLPQNNGVKTVYIK